MKNIVVLTGAGISAESGISTYDDPDGLWDANNYYEVASAKGWKKDREKVLNFWNKVRRQMLNAQPNAAHTALASLEQYFHVEIITQNVDNLHERAGSQHVLHLHGEITQARSSLDKTLIYDIQAKDILLGELCDKNSQLRPNIVWFGEHVPLFSNARTIVKTADILLVIGCALDVYPAASLVTKCQPGTPVYTVNPSLELNNDFNLSEKASTGVPRLVDTLIQQYATAHIPST